MLEGQNSLLLQVERYLSEEIDFCQLDKQLGQVKLQTESARNRYMLLESKVAAIGALVENKIAQLTKDKEQIVKRKKQEQKHQKSLNLIM